MILISEFWSERKDERKLIRNLTSNKIFLLPKNMIMAISNEQEGLRKLRNRVVEESWD